MTGFQTQVNYQPAPAIEGDWASSNPRASMLAGPGGFVADPINGVIAGRFAWADPLGIVRNAGGLGRLGFVSRHQPSVIQTWPGIGGANAQATLIVPPGLDITLHDSADVWARFAAGALVGQKVFAKYLDGSAVAGTAGTPPQAASVTGAIAAGTATFTGSIAAPVNGTTGGASVLTASAVTGTIVTGGSALSGTGVVTGQTIVSQLPGGTPGGAGTYLLGLPQGIVTAQALTDTYGTFTVSVVGSGSLGIGDLLAGTNVTGAPVIIAFGTGTGNTGTYFVSVSETAASATVTATGALESRWYVDSYAAAGELAKITTRG